MRILTLTTLYPNAAAPNHGVFVENRLTAFAVRTGAEIRVIAPVPWFPVGAEWAGRYAKFAHAPAEEIRGGLRISHPRYAIPPKVGMNYAAAALERCFLAAARAAIAEGFDFDLIDAHYLYPDGVAAVRAARKLGKPVVVTARGSDATLIPRYARQKRMILEALFAADAVIAVAPSLKEDLIGIGAPPDKIRVLRNGVDRDLFRPLGRAAIRAEMGLEGPVAASVGALIERKGHHLLIEALAAAPELTLLIAGDGPERASLAARAERLGVAGRVRFLGEIAHQDLPRIYNAADVLMLASSREGWANVLLEAMACGTPVVAAPAGAAAEAVSAPEAGLVVEERTPDAMLAALSALIAAPPERAATRRHAERFSWDETSDGLDALFKSVVAARRRTASIRTRPIEAPAAPRLLVTVDVEETFDWSRFDDASRRIEDPEGLARLHRLVAERGAKPLYFLTWPIIKDAAFAAWLRRIADGADLGLHLHQWATPPAEGFAGEYYSWQCNLPAAVHLAKLASLSGAFEDAFGRAPRAHRAGRYGADAGIYPALATLGVDLDFSPSPGFDWSARGGPDFSAMSNAPFLMETDRGAVAVTPASGVWMVKRTDMTVAHDAPAGFFCAPRRAPRAVAAPARLSCEGITLSALKAMTRRLIADESPVLVFSVHSTSLTPGANPYATDGAAVEAMLDVTGAYLDWFRDEAGGALVSLADVAALYGLNER